MPVEPNEIGLFHCTSKRNFRPNLTGINVIISQPGEAGCHEHTDFTCTSFLFGYRSIIVIKKLEKDAWSRRFPVIRPKRVSGNFYFFKSYNYFSEDNARFLNSRSLTAFQK